MTSREYTQWRAFDRLQPIGDDRLDILVGTLIAHVRAALGDKRVKPVSEYVPQWAPKTTRPKRQPGNVIVEKTRRILAQLGVKA